MTNKYVATVSLPGKTVKVPFKSRATHTGTVHVHAVDAAARAGYHSADGAVVVRVVADLGASA